MSFDLRTFPNDTALAAAAASDWLLELQSAAGRTTKLPYTVALSGGRIARTFYQETTRQIEANPAAFKDVFARTHFFWADERCVPPDDAESNFRAAHELLFAPLQIADARIHRIHGEDPPESAAQKATMDICHVAPKNSDGQPILDLIFLGMGEDGHVASLFPGKTEGTIPTETFCVVKNSPKPPPNRITLSYAAITAAKNVWTLVSGAGKEAALRESLNSSGKTPLARVIQSRSHTRIFNEIRLN